MTRPNIVFFLVDDMGCGDIGCYGNTFHETPAIDQLCNEGVKFTQAYSACTVCSPSRAALLTGRYPARLHLTDWIAGHEKPYGKLKVPDWNMRVDHERITLPKALKKAGYETHFIGKWHLMPHLEPEIMNDYLPEKQGFDTNTGGREWGQPKGPGKYFHPFGMPDVEGEEGDYLTDILTDKAVGIINSKPEKPFLLYLSYYILHGPLMTKESYKEKYKQKAADSGLDYHDRHFNYAGMVQSMDESVDRVLTALKENGLDENTIIVYTADNGGVHNYSNGGLREGKGHAYEGGTRVCQMIKYPKVVTPGSQYSYPVIHNDLYPTLLEMAGLPAESEEHLDGVSLAKSIKENSSISRNDLYWHYPHYHNTLPYSAVRSGDMKLIEFLEDGKHELYDLKNDPAEKTNLAKDKPETTASLLKNLNNWRKMVGAQMMESNPNYDPDRENEGSRRPKPKGPEFLTE